MIKLNPLVKNHVLKHMACLVLEHAPKCLFFLSIKIDRVRKEHFGHLRKIICESFHFRKNINKKWKFEIGEPLGMSDCILEIKIKQRNKTVKL